MKWSKIYVSFFFELSKAMRLIVAIAYKLAINLRSKNSNWELKTSRKNYPGEKLSN